MKTQSALLAACLILMASCGSDELPYDAFGHFETTEWNIGPEVMGKVIDVFVDEGDAVARGDTLCQIDTIEWVLNLRKLEAVWKSLDAKLMDPEPEIRVLEERERVLLKEIDRVEKLLSGGAATQKQLDDLEGELAIVRRQIESARSQAETTNLGILSERESIEAEMEIVRDKIRRCTLLAPADGNIIIRNIEPGEMASVGMVFFKLARMDELQLRAYIEGSRISEISLGQEVSVGIAESDTLSGTISWISERAEFSPKFVETREERADRVYAFKVRVVNSGELKIGMPGEVFLGRGATGKSEQQ